MVAEYAVDASKLRVSPGSGKRPQVKRMPEAQESEGFSATLLHFIGIPRMLGRFFRRPLSSIFWK
jgi:hypothetical protein